MPRNYLFAVAPVVLVLQVYLVVSVKRKAVQVGEQGITFAVAEGQEGNHTDDTEWGSLCYCWLQADARGNQDLITLKLDAYAYERFFRNAEDRCKEACVGEAVAQGWETRVIACFDKCDDKCWIETPNPDKMDKFSKEGLEADKDTRKAASFKECADSDKTGRKTSCFNKDEDGFKGLTLPDGFKGLGYKRMNPGMDFCRSGANYAFTKQYMESMWVDKEEPCSPEDPGCTSAKCQSGECSTNKSPYDWKPVDPKKTATAGNGYHGVHILEKWAKTEDCPGKGIARLCQNMDRSSKHTWIDNGDCTAVGFRPSSFNKAWDSTTEGWPVNSTSGRSFDEVRYARVGLGSSTSRIYDAPFYKRYCEYKDENGADLNATKYENRDFTIMRNGRKVSATACSKAILDLLAVDAGYIRGNSHKRYPTSTLTMAMTALGSEKDWINTVDSCSLKTDDMCKATFTDSGRKVCWDHSSHWATLWCCLRGADKKGTKARIQDPKLFAEDVMKDLKLKYGEEYGNDSWTDHFEARLNKARSLCIDA